jgi:co-chaperonin GroES (HSP10)
MRIGRILGSAVAASVALTPIAATASQTVGSVVSVNGDAYVAREGRLLRAQPAMAVKAGDRVITRSGASASVAMNGCSVNVAGGEMKTLGGSCGSVETASFSRAASKSDGSSALAGGAGGGVIVIALIAIGAIVVGIVAATRNNNKPTSP